jgi:hypothetical protein
MIFQLEDKPSDNITLIKNARYYYLFFPVKICIGHFLQVNADCIFTESIERAEDTLLCSETED